MGPSVIVEEVHRSSSWPFFSSGRCELTSVYGTGDGVALQEQSTKQHSPRISESIKEKLLGVEVRFGNWNRKRPEWLLFALYQLCENLLDRATSPALDVFLANKAYEEEKQICAIETTQEQCNPIKSLTQDEIVFAINCTVAYLEHLYITERLFEINTERSISTLVKEYRCGNLNERYFQINEFPMADFFTEKSERDLALKIDHQLRKDIIARRNKRMAYRLDSLLSGNPHLTIFSAIGTGHFFGNNSVIQHLQQMGYIVKNVRDHDAILPPQNVGEEITFNFLWLRDQSSAPIVSVEVTEVKSTSALLYFCALFSLFQLC
ncbi:hypothetical protein RB195_024972 [Necator americanus]|uniref:Metalloprotease TIKI homolog n=1 Tax=Necator americanus TaxID=51031 RepID=A0ABR1EQL6_NECAM